MKKILVTGSAGFIGMHLCKSLLEDDYVVIGIDNINDYYDPLLKQSRLKQLSKFNNFHFYKTDISNFEETKLIFEKFKPDKVVNLAAQTGVRYSLENPQAYIDSNLFGFMNILELSRDFNTKGLIYASSSSVYGGNEKTQLSESDNVDKPLSIYAVSKKSNELMAHSYSHLYGLNTTGLRFFTVYGPWGRPDMAMYIFTKKIIANQPISVFNYGKMKRAFTYVDDVINGTRAAIDKNYKYDIFNIGNNSSENLLDMINIIENSLGINAKINFEEIQPGDVKNTSSDMEHSKNKLNFEPKISIHEGIPTFVEWFKKYHKQL